MKEIILNQGKVALVDDSDYEYLNQWKWSLKSHYGRLFYAQRNQWIAGGKGKHIPYLRHRVILNVTDGKIIVDHKNGNGLDNQRHNLRLSDKSTNAFNAVGHRDKKHSKFKGVTFDFEKDKWVSQISVKGKRTMKRFDSEIEAALFYNQCAIKLHGEFANLNSIPK